MSRFPTPYKGKSFEPTRTPHFRVDRYVRGTWVIEIHLFGYHVGICW